jgi:hypothetical protein
VLLGLVPQSMDLAVGLSPRVHAALPELVERVVGEARALGFVFLHNSTHTASVPDRRVDVARLAGLR